MSSLLCEQACHGIIENAVLLGTPIGRNVERWRKIRSVVAGRLINGYSDPKHDWVLYILYRSKVRMVTQQALS